MLAVVFYRSGRAGADEGHCGGIRHYAATGACEDHGVVSDMCNRTSYRTAAEGRDEEDW